jgi:NADPH:quinone reductase-like Zn-dependent oxidoreductase
MKALVLRSYGPPDQLELADVDTPVPAADEVLVRVRATSVNPYDWHHMRGEPRVARLMPGTLGLRAPKLRILGCDVAGQVEAVGQDVTEFRSGDEVFALLERGGGFAEYVSVPARLLARRPGNLSYEQAAAVPMAATTALLGSRSSSSGPQAELAPSPCRSPGRSARGSMACAVPRTRTWSGRSARMTPSTTPRRTSRGADGATTCCWTSREAARRSPAGGC